MSTCHFLSAANWTIISTSKILNVWLQFRLLLERKRIFPQPSVLRDAFRARQRCGNPQPHQVGQTIDQTHNLHLPREQRRRVLCQRSPAGPDRSVYCWQNLTGPVPEHTNTPVTRWGEKTESIAGRTWMEVKRIQQTRTRDKPLVIVGVTVMVLNEDMKSCPGRLHWPVWVGVTTAAVVVVVVSVVSW